MCLCVSYPLFSNSAGWPSQAFPEILLMWLEEAWGGILQTSNLYLCWLRCVKLSFSRELQPSLGAGEEKRGGKLWKVQPDKGLMKRALEHYEIKFLQHGVMHAWKRTFPAPARVTLVQKLPPSPRSSCVLCAAMGLMRAPGPQQTYECLSPHHGCRRTAMLAASS